MKRPLYFLLIFVFCLFPFTFIHAQIPTSIDGIDITITPPNPIPGKNVEISLQDYLSDISTANITWMVNSQKVTSGIGKNDINLTAPALGKESDVTISIQT